MFHICLEYAQTKLILFFVEFQIDTKNSLTRKKDELILTY